MRSAFAMIRLHFAAILVLAATALARAEGPDPANWDAVLAEARGQTVYFNAWGGSENINAYIEWAGQEMRRRFDVEVVHVKLDDTAHAVGRILTEKAAGRTEGGSVDLIWINGENFAAMKREGLLHMPGWAESLPNWRFVDVAGKPTVRFDFTIPVEGLESPWGMARLVFFHDSARTDPADMPRSAAMLLQWARQNPGRFTYPQPPDFTGSSFLKQVLLELAGDREALRQAPENFDAVAAPLFAWLDELHPLLWRGGRAFPRNYPAMKQLLADGEIEIMFAFNPSEASNAIANGELPDSVRSFVFSGGTLGNTHFVAIPFNASARAGAMVLADFLLSPEAQARKEDPGIWGDPTVLDLKALEAEDRARFESLELGVATLAPDELGPALEEPHPAWMERLEEEWNRRYGVAN
jgi:putative thiamine transport system substrate-binding protein